ncbi:MAG: ParB/RepB/Spo0J family partition protein [Brevundimonas sp.]|uniref:ParB/RepB/Spo0J family partition protein n=1 Tax=Brevundimonas sp. TaxID=1871086 RepID=UPI00391A8F4E
MSDRQRGLGRGLSALLSEAAETEVPVDQITGKSQGRGESRGVRELPLDQLEPNPDQPRRHFAEDEIASLAQSIAEHGVLQPILVRAHGERWQIIAGERRWRAARRAGLVSVPVVERSLEDLAVLEVAIIENVQREDLNPVEEARAYQMLIERFSRTQEQLAKAVGKSRSHIANLVRLLSLPEPVLALVESGQLSAGHARTLVTSDRAEALAERIVREGLSVRDAEKLAREGGEQPRPKAVRPAKAPDTIALETDLSNALGLKVEVRDRDGRGEVVIGYGTLDQLDEICRRLTRG